MLGKYLLHSAKLFIAGDMQISYSLSYLFIIGIENAVESATEHREMAEIDINIDPTSVTGWYWWN